MGKLQVDFTRTPKCEKKFKAADSVDDVAMDSENSSLPWKAEMGVSTDDKEAYVSDGESGAEKVINLRWYRKCLFALGGTPYQMLTNVIGFFVTIYLLNVAQLPTMMSSAILLGGRVCDAITDPLIGILVEKSPYWRFGKLKTWMIISMPLTCIVFWLFWFVPAPFQVPIKDATTCEVWARFAYYFVLMLLLQLLFTCHQVPFTSLTMYISNNKKVRDSATAFRMAFEMIGVLFGVLVSSILIKNNKGCAPSMVNESLSLLNNSTTMNNFTADNFSAALINTSAERKHYTGDEIRSSYQLAAGVLVAVHAVCVLSVVLGVKEYRGVSQTVHREPFLQGLRRALGFRPYVILMFAFLQIGFVMQNVQANLVLYVTYTLRLSETALSLGLFTMLGTGVICVPIWQLVQNRWGKQVAFAGGLIAVLPALFVMLCVPPAVVSQSWVFYPLCGVSGASVSVAYLCPWSMLPDVIDAYFLKKGVRHTSVFYSFYVFFSKLAVGVAIGVSQIVLGLAGYKNGECDQPEEVRSALRYLISVPSLAAAFGSLLCVYLYPITESVRKQHDGELRHIRQFEVDSSESLTDSKASSEPEANRVDGESNDLQTIRCDSQLLAPTEAKADCSDSGNSNASSSYASSRSLLTNNRQAEPTA